MDGGLEASVFTYILLYCQTVYQKLVQLSVEIFNGRTKTTKTYMRAHECHNVRHLKLELAQYKAAYALAISTERIRATWAVVGAPRLTRKCLQWITNGGPQHVFYHNACNLLSAMGFNGKNLKVVLKKEKL